MGLGGVSGNSRRGGNPLSMLDIAFSSGSLAGQAPSLRGVAQLTTTAPSQLEQADEQASSGTLKAK